MFKAKQWRIVQAKCWLHSNDLPYFTVAVSFERKTSLLSYCMSSDCYKFRHDLPEIECNHQVFHCFEVKESNLKMVSTDAMVDYATIYCVATSKLLS